MATAAARLEAVNTFLVNSFNDIFEQLTSITINSTATFSKYSQWRVA
jgi:hypothetical protein